jgi:hypothetical protein
MPRGVSRVDEAQLQGRLWVPLVLRPALWLDAADVSTITIATGVSEWRDKSGNSRHATQATASLQPGYSQSALRGRPGLIWPVVASATTVNRVLNTTSFNIGISNIAATFAVARMDSGAAMSGYRRLFVSNSVSPFGYSLWYFGTGSASQTMLQIAGTVTIGADWAVGTERNSPFVLSMVGPNNGGVAANNLRSRLNGGVSTNTRTDATGTVGGTNQLVIGAGEAAYTAGQYSWSGEISEIVHFNTTLSPRDVNIIEGYLAWKWGITLAASHPFANRPPVIGD